MKMMSMSILTLLLNKAFVYSTSDDLYNLIKNKVENSLPDEYPTNYKDLVSSFDTSELINYNKDGLTVSTLDDYWTNLNIDETMKMEAYKYVSQLKYVESETIVLQNISSSTGALNYNMNFFIIAGSNKNSSISLNYWYGPVKSVDIQQSVWQGCCDEVCDIGCCKCWFHSGCGGCSYDRSFTTGEIYAIYDSLSYTARSKIISSIESKMRINKKMVKDNYLNNIGLNYFKLYNNSLIRKEQSNITSQMVVDYADIECIDEKNILDFIKKVYKPGGMGKTELKLWLSLKEGEHVISYYNINNNHYSALVNKDMYNKCYNVIIVTTKFDYMDKMVLNRTSYVKNKDTYKYKYIAINETNPYLYYTQLDKYIFNYMAYESYIINKDNERKSIYFNGKIIKDEWLLPYENRDEGIWDTLITGIVSLAKDLKINISNMGTPSVSKAVSLNTCLGFDTFQVSTDSAQIECVAHEDTDDFVKEVFEELFWADANESVKIQRELSYFEYGSNVSWSISDMSFSSTNTTTPGFAKVWKQKDPTRDCTNWLISFSYGKVKLAPDYYEQVTTNEYLWGAISRTSVSFFQNPHKVTPQDLLALQNFFFSVINNNQCITVGADAFIKDFPNLDC